MACRPVDPCFSKGIPFPGDVEPILSRPEADAVNVSSPTGKYPAPLQDNPSQHPSRYEAARAFAIKMAEHPKA